MTIIAQTPNAAGVATAETQSSTIAGTAQNTISSNQFVYFAGFDGTNNNRKAVYVSGNELDTNVAQLTYQVESISNSNIGFRYFPGPGTGGITDPSAAFPTEKIYQIANAAYQDFSEKATAWLVKTLGAGLAKSHLIT